MIEGKKYDYEFSGWAPCFHRDHGEQGGGPDATADVRKAAWLAEAKVPTFYTGSDATENLVWIINAMGGSVSLDSDQWVLVKTEGTIYVDPKDECDWEHKPCAHQKHCRSLVKADDFYLGLVKTFLIWKEWREKELGPESALP